ncbi:MAG: VWA domain-containing protein [Pseudomonadota bacterium]
MPSRRLCYVVLVLLTTIAIAVAADNRVSKAQEVPFDAEERPYCTEDAMIVFDASGSMAGNTVQGLFSDKTRIGEVRAALTEVLPGVTQFRRVGLITYGPGPYQQCNVRLNFPPEPKASQRILSIVNEINPAGKTPIVNAVVAAARIFKHVSAPGTIVLLTDGEETCGGDPCELGKLLKRESENLTVHVIGYQLRSFRWTGAQRYLETKCLAEETGGYYITANNRQDLIEAFRKTLGCPMMSALPRSTLR